MGQVGSAISNVAGKVWDGVKNVAGKVGSVVSGVANVAGKIAGGVRQGIDTITQLPVVGGIARGFLDASPYGRAIDMGSQLVSSIAPTIEGAANAISGAAQGGNLHDMINAGKGAYDAGRNIAGQITDMRQRFRAFGQNNNVPY